MHGRLPATEAAATESLYDACGKDSMTTSYWSLSALNLETHSWITASSSGLPAEWVHRLRAVLPPVWAGGSVACAAWVGFAAVVGWDPAGVADPPQAVRMMARASNR